MSQETAKSRRPQFHELPLCLSGARLPGPEREFSQLLSVFTSREVRIVVITEPNPCIVMVVGVGGVGGWLWGTGWGSRNNEIVFLPNLSFCARKT